ncbi:hypothetical protein B0H10DRAFT_1963774 [Mycena sp. CBHHK59/15]|nr:hypothetical protein B0H10DRAFT_1963774 [Mycena sp. CBHHK59/15]
MSGIGPDNVLVAHGKYIVILFYDHLLTLNTEIAHIWHKFPNEMSRCHKLHAARGFPIVGQQLLVGCTLFLRVCAMYASSKRVRFSVLAAGLITVTIGAFRQGLVQFYTLHCRVAMKCNPEPSHSLVSFNFPFAQTVDMSCNCRLAYNILVLGLTLHRGYKQTRVVLSSSVSLWQVMVRDGVMYFGVSWFTSAYDNSP